MVDTTRRSRICIIDGCESFQTARGWCGKHYDRWRHNGDPLVTLTTLGMSAEERFWLKVDKNGPGGCWLWTGHIYDAGYGCFKAGGQVSAHRFAYELLVGPIPEGLVLDHIKKNGCTSRACVKAVADEYGLAHLEPVTNQENTLRGEMMKVNLSKTHCPNGHEYVGYNVIICKNGSRQCRACGVERAARDRAKKRLESTIVGG